MRLLIYKFTSVTNESVQHLYSKYIILYVIQFKPISMLHCDDVSKLSEQINLVFFFLPKRAYILKDILLYTTFDLKLSIPFSLSPSGR